MFTASQRNSSPTLNQSSSRDSNFKRSVQGLPDGVHSMAVAAPQRMLTTHQIAPSPSKIVFEFWGFSRS
jgi:hypothetical protein